MSFNVNGTEKGGKAAAGSIKTTKKTPAVNNNDLNEQYEVSSPYYVKITSGGTGEAKKSLWEKCKEVAGKYVKVVKEVAGQCADVAKGYIKVAYKLESKVTSWITNSIKGLFSKAQETNKAVEEAKKDPGKKAVAVEKSTELIVQVMKENPKIFSQETAQKIMEEIKKAPPDQVIEMGKILADGLDIVKKTGDHNLYLSTLKGVDFWFKNIVNCNNLSDGAKKLANELLQKAKDAGKVITDKFKNENEQATQNDPNKKDALKINEEGKVTGAAGVCLNSISRTTENMDFISPEQKTGLKESVADFQSLAAEILHIADIKGYTLDNFDQLASIAGAGNGEAVEVSPTSDMAQLSLLSKIKLEFNNLTKDVMELLTKNREMNEGLDKAAAEKKAQINAEEKKYIETARLKKEELKKLINNIQDKKLQNKLTAELLALSYMINNPEQISRALIEAIRDDMNKITWTFIIKPQPNGTQ